MSFDSQNSSFAVQISGLSKCYQISRDNFAETTLIERAVRSVKRAGRSVLQLRGGGEVSSKQDFWALKNVDLEIQQGQKFGIMGRNGAGKSTLLKILSRVTEPTKGRIAIRGRVASLLEVGTGFNPELTGRENIFLNGAILGMPQQEIRRKFDEIVAFAEVEGFLDTPVKRYSSGMYVRLAFAVAAHLDSEILIVDEVLAVGDAQFQKKCLGKMDDAASVGRTVIFVSHSSATVARLCTHAALLAHGQVVMQGSSQEVIRRYLGAEAGPETIFVLPEDNSKDLNLIKVELNPGGSGSTQLLYGEPIRFRITYRVHRRVRDCMVWLAVQTRDGQVVFCTADSDQSQSLLFEYREVGTYEATVEFPARWLNYGDYSVVIGLVRNSPVEVFHREEALFFEVDESGMPSAATGSGSRAGIIQPELGWNISRIE